MPRAQSPVEFLNLSPATVADSGLGFAYNGFSGRVLFDILDFTLTKAFFEHERNDLFENRCNLRETNLAAHGFSRLGVVSFQITWRHSSGRWSPGQQTFLGEVGRLVLEVKRLFWS